MILQDPKSYADLHSDKNFPGCTITDINTYLSQFSKNLDSKALNLYNGGFIKYVRVSAYNFLLYIRSALLMVHKKCNPGRDVKVCCVQC